MSSDKFLSPAHLKAVCEREGAFVLDVRTDLEYEENRLASPHIQIPLHKLKVEELQSRGVTPNSSVVILCQSGQRAMKAMTILESAGFKKLFVIEGGLHACEKEGLSCRRGTQSVISLERQVRISAGVIIVVGAMLALFSSIYFMAIPLFVGSGLIFAGVTNWCGLGLLLARAPWNQRSEKENV